MGIGLTLSKLLVDLQGGEIRVESAPGKGAVFSFTIPAARPADEPGAPGEAAQPG